MELMTGLKATSIEDVYRIGCFQGLWNKFQTRSSLKHGDDLYQTDYGIFLLGSLATNQCSITKRFARQGLNLLHQLAVKARQGWNRPNTKTWPDWPGHIGEWLVVSNMLVGLSNGMMPFRHSSTSGMCYLLCVMITKGSKPIPYLHIFAGGEARIHLPVGYMVGVFSRNVYYSQLMMAAPALVTQHLTSRALSRHFLQ